MPGAAPFSYTHLDVYKRQSYIRDAVLPLPESREISVRIESPDTAVRGVHYEVRSTDTERLIEDGELTELERDGSEIRATFQLMDLLEDGGEYLLVIRLELEQGQEAYYYTHIANVGSTHLEECLELVDTIHNALFDKNNTVSIAQYMDCLLYTSERDRRCRLSEAFL